MDRNNLHCVEEVSGDTSLSARRAWIEIAVLELIPLTDPVALRKESVDRNSKNPMICVNEIPSLSARRAWIEITTWCSCPYILSVALRKESVDRNHYPAAGALSRPRRSPQGERG